MFEQIEGIVSSIVFSNAENGYTVLRLDTAEGLVTAAGTFPGVVLGETLLIDGQWSTHPQYGEQFKAETFEVKPPTGKEEVFRYLSSGAVKNIGPGRAREIVDKFGAQALYIIENDPDKLAGIKGISLRTARKIGLNYQRQAGLRNLIEFFRRFNIRPLVATLLYKDYGDDAGAAVRENPYLIANEAYGAKFHEADSIALDLGFESDCAERVSAALLFTLTHNLSNGHTFIPKDRLTAAVVKLIGVSEEPIIDAINALQHSGEIVIDSIAGLDACYLQALYEAECNIVKRLQTSKTKTLPNPAIDDVGATSPSDRRHPCAQPAIDDVGATSCRPRAAKCRPYDKNIQYSNLQLEALKLASEHKTLVLTGGPGTGKTTTVRGILKLFNDNNLKTSLCAPTGRAAKRLSELCGAPAATIHRMLGAAPSDTDGRHSFEHDELNPLDTDALIVDESSMIDILLMDALMRALKPECRIVLVGDADQLPPIGPGNVFTDIIRSEAVATVRLTEIFRQAEGSGIVRCAHSVNNGVMPDLAEKYPDLFFMPRQTDEPLAQTIAELYAERLPKNMSINPAQIQVLSPTRKGISGTTELNVLLRDKLNPRVANKKEKQTGENFYRVGDKVMQVKNNYDILWKGKVAQSGTPAQGAGVFNGDVGYITDIDHSRETLTVDFEDKLVTYPFNRLSELEPAFAITVHKSQGSEYHAVILAMTEAAPPLLTRSVLYTAMTRARNLLVIVGNQGVMNRMVLNDKRQKRYSGLRYRLAGEFLTPNS